jgi:HEAT repeat protein
MEKLIPKALFAVFGLLAAIVAVRFFVNGHRVESSQELTELALQAGNRDDQEHAAARLEALADKTPGTGPRNAMQPFLARLLNESDNSGVRAAAMRGLVGIWDYECMSKMLDLLDDPSPQVRDTAARSVAVLISAEARFDANAATEQRAAATKRLRDLWVDFNGRTLQSWQRRLEEKDAKP